MNRAKATSIWLLIVIGGCARAGDTGFSWPAGQDAIPDEHTAIMVSLAIFRGQLHRDIGDEKDVAKQLEAFRYRTSDLAHDLKGDAWFVQPTPEQKAKFDKECAGNCVGGELYTMALFAHDGRVLEFYIPQ